MNQIFHPLHLRNDAKAALLEVVWNDGQIQSLAHGLLRARCQCAHCRKAPAEPAEAVRLIDLRPIGQYGVQMVFDDGHERGIYPWVYLRALGASVDETIK